MIIDTNAISTCADGCQKVDVALTAQPLVALLNDLKFGVARQHVEISVGDAGDSLRLDPRGSATANQIADFATGSLTAVKPSTRQCLVAGSCAA